MKLKHKLKDLKWSLKIREIQFWQDFTVFFFNNNF